MTALADAGLSHRKKALAYNRTGRVAVVHAVSAHGHLAHEATVRIMASDVGGPERLVLLDGQSVTCTCTAASSVAAPGCPHAYAALLALGRGGSQ